MATGGALPFMLYIKQPRKRSEKVSTLLVLAR